MPFTLCLPIIFNMAYLSLITRRTNIDNEVFQTFIDSIERLMNIMGEIINDPTITSLCERLNAWMVTYGEFYLNMQSMFIHQQHMEHMRHWANIRQQLLLNQLVGLIDAGIEELLWTHMPGEQGPVQPHIF